MNHVNHKPWRIVEQGLWEALLVDEIEESVLEEIKKELQHDFDIRPSERDEQKVPLEEAIEEPGPEEIKKELEQNFDNGRSDLEELKDWLENQIGDPVPEEAEEELQQDFDDRPSDPDELDDTVGEAIEDPVLEDSENELQCGFDNAPSELDEPKAPLEDAMEDPALAEVEEELRQDFDIAVEQADEEVQNFEMKTEEIQADRDPQAATAKTPDESSPNIENRKAGITGKLIDGDTGPIKVRDEKPGKDGGSGNTSGNGGGGGGNNIGGRFHERLGPIDFSGALKDGLKVVRRNMSIIMVFSTATNILVLAIPIYLFQISDRVLTSRSVDTLIMLTAVIVGAVVALVISLMKPVSLPAYWWVFFIAGSEAR